MEEKIYSRQVTKMSTALRVVDEHQIKRYFKMDELAQLYQFTPADPDVRETPIVPKVIFLRLHNKGKSSGAKRQNKKEGHKAEVQQR